MSTEDKTLQTILDKLETLANAVQLLTNDVDALKDSREARAFFRLGTRRNVPERPGNRRKRIHQDIYFAFAGDKDVYRAGSILEFAALYRLDYGHGTIGGAWKLAGAKDRKSRLHAEATVARTQLKQDGIELVMFAYYLSEEYEPVPYVELWDPHEPEIDAWIESNGCIVNNHWEQKTEQTDDDRDPKKRLDKCRKCAFCRETAEKAIRCSRHKASVPKYYTKRDVRNYLESARKVCEFPKCFKPKETAVEQADA